MIRIHRSTKPKILVLKGKAATDAMIDDFRKGNKVFHFKKSIYSSTKVKAALIEAQCGKCAFCEALIAHVSYGDVEHFRPKAGCKQNPDEPLESPGYFWLAYEWENLLFSCEICNNNKGNQFPLAKSGRRSKSPDDLLKGEKPLLIDPAAEEPSKFVRFREEIAYHVGGKVKGRRTIEIVDLNREKLSSRRSDILKELKETWECYREFTMSVRPEHVAMANKLEASIRSRMAPSSEYSAMARDYLKSVGFI